MTENTDQNTPFLIVLDGARGAGKSTVHDLLKSELDNTAFIGLDLMRNLVTNAAATDECNRVAFEALFAVTNAFLTSGVNVAIDSGVTAERVNALKDIAHTTNSRILFFHLTAPREVLWERITKRGEANGRMPNPERFAYTYQKQQNKDFRSFITFDTTQYTPRDVADRILSSIQ